MDCESGLCCEGRQTEPAAQPALSLLLCERQGTLKKQMVLLGDQASEFYKLVNMLPSS